MPPFTVYYVYAREPRDGKDWVEVGQSATRFVVPLFFRILDDDRLVLLRVDLYLVVMGRAAWSRPGGDGHRLAGRELPVHSGR